MDPRAREVLDYWFGDLDATDEYLETRNALWFGGEEETDAYIREKFEADVVRAASGQLDEWKSSLKGSLALIVLLDQFSLNLYREQPRSYEQSALAIPIARELVQKGWDTMLSPLERVFVYLPFEHSENLADQELSVKLYSALASSAHPAFEEPMKNYLDYAERHFRAVKRFGRFPDRNPVFGRESTDDEIAFLQANPYGF